ncbi:hypothetical protein [Pseudomonas syringae]|uniref:hypothetical protein n=1 Tax=Pseudomonas syringae TaxID=317 RepID=UPI0004631D0C|nr:hypothetical protein [Pseudomonas syringae]
MQFFAGRDVPVLMLCVFCRGQSLLKGFRTTDFDSTIKQLSPYTVLDEELVQISSEVLVHARIIVTVAEVVIEPLNDVIYLEPLALLKPLNVFLMDIGSLSPVLLIGQNFQGLTDDLAKV